MTHHSRAAGFSAEERRAVTVFRNALAAILVMALALAMSACAKDEPVTTHEHPTTASDTPGSEMGTTDDDSADGSAEAQVPGSEDAQLLAERISAFVRGYVLADTELLVSALNAENAARVSEIAPALEMGGPIGEFLSETTTADAVIIETAEEGSSTWWSVPLTAPQGMMVSVLTWQGTAEAHAAESTVEFTFVYEDGSYVIDLIDGRPASEQLVQ